MYQSRTCTDSLSLRRFECGSVQMNPASTNLSCKHELHDLAYDVSGIHLTLSGIVTFVPAIYCESTSM